MAQEDYPGRTLFRFAAPTVKQREPSETLHLTRKSLDNGARAHGTTGAAPPPVPLGLTCINAISEPVLSLFFEISTPLCHGTDPTRRREGNRPLVGCFSLDPTERRAGKA
jgi:hypothetical protein